MSIHNYLLLLLFYISLQRHSMVGYLKTSVLFIFSRYFMRISRASAVLVVFWRRARRGRQKGARWFHKLALLPSNMLSRLVIVSGLHRF